MAVFLFKLFLRQLFQMPVSFAVIPMYPNGPPVTFRAEHYSQPPTICQLPSGRPMDTMVLLKVNSATAEIALFLVTDN